jgi:hypothetical protein
MGPPPLLGAVRDSATDGTGLTRTATRSPEPKRRVLFFPQGHAVLTHVTEGRHLT